VNQQISTDTWEIDGQQLRLPVQMRDATVAAAVYTADAAAARSAVEGTPFVPVTLAGRALSVLVCVHYIDGDLGSYDEFGVELLVRGPGRRVGPVTLHLPVTAPFTQSAGRSIWGLPKYQASGTIITEERQTRVEISAGDNFILAGSIAGGIPLPGRFRAKVGGWSVGLQGANEGTVLYTASRLRVSGIRMRFGGRTLAWGHQHPMALVARSLGMARRPICSVTARRLEAEIGSAASVDAPRP
jgi:Acetoacetate decarboxylase (ADC)